MYKPIDFQPNWVSLPGDTIRDILSEQRLSLIRFAEKMEKSNSYINQLLLGEIPISGQIADQLEGIFGVPADFWLLRESQYREDFARIKKIEEEKWIQEIPIGDMIRFGWIQNTQNKIDTALQYFNVPNVRTWRERFGEIISATTFRTSASFKSQPASIFTWIRQGEIQSETLICNEWNSDYFKESLNLIRPLTRKKAPKDFLPKLKEICANCGVAIAIVKTPTACKASGATKFINSKKALMLLSFRHLTDDQFWFTFYHEAGHLLLHNHRSIFIEEGAENTENQQEEKEANDFAAKYLVPDEFQNRLKTVKFNKREIVKLALDAGVSPGIIMGQLQHMGRVSFQKFNYYKRRFNWQEISELDI